MSLMLPIGFDDSAVGSLPGADGILRTGVGIALARAKRCDRCFFSSGTVLNAGQGRSLVPACDAELRLGRYEVKLR